MDNIVRVNPLAVCVLAHGPGECPDPFNRLESMA